jgi:hypothetical protein
MRKCSRTLRQAKNRTGGGGGGGKRTAGVTHLLIQQVVRKPAQINLHVLLGAKLPSVRLRGFSVQIDAKQ